MDIITYLGIALFHMRIDAIHKYRAKSHYDWVGSMIRAITWPLTDILFIAQVIWGNHHPVIDKQS